MTDKEKKDYLKAFKAYMEEQSATPESSKRFLKDIGVLTKSGNLSSHYKPEIINAR